MKAFEGWHLRIGQRHIIIKEEGCDERMGNKLSTENKDSMEKPYFAKKPFEELQISDDFMFSVIMRNPKYCKPFLERILGVRISRIEYPEYQDTIDLTYDAKSVRLDIFVEGDEDSVYCIEMQTTNNKNLPKRARYYESMIDLNILEKGEDYRKLKKNFVIFVCTFDLFKKGRHIYTFEKRCVQEPEMALGDETTTIILNTKGTKDDVSPEMKKLLDYIDGKEPEDSYTKELDEAVVSTRKNEKWKVSYMTLQMHYQEKFEQGLEQGIEQGNRQSALRMLQEGDLPVEKIAKYSGLTVDEVLELEKEEASQPV